jgi:hypothetical protein
MTPHDTRGSDRIPASDHGKGTFAAFGAAVADGPLALALHALLGTLLVVSAVTFVIRAVLARKTTATVNPGMAWTAMTQALTPHVVPSCRYVYPLVRFFQRSVAILPRPPGSASSSPGPMPSRDQWSVHHRARQASPYPATVADPAVQGQAARTAQDLARHAPTATGRIGLS